MFSNIVRFLGGDPHKREIEKISKVVEQINELEETYEKFSDQACRLKKHPNSASAWQKVRHSMIFFQRLLPQCERPANVPWACAITTCR
jgi:preprotein translocase subunit SecA